MHVKVNSIKLLEPSSGVNDDEILVPMRPHEASVGDTIRVAIDCYDDTEPRCFLSEGFQGYIQSIDADGDFELSIDGRLYWMFRDRLNLISRRTSMANILHEFQQLSDEVGRWKLQASN